MGEQEGVEEQPDELAADPRECPYELPPLDGSPFMSPRERARAVRRVIEQAEHERASKP